MRSLTCQINSIEVMLIHQPQAVQAAALWQVDAGALQEPDAWPGLAHLLEHMLFRGSQHFPDKQRLMHWVPGQGGRLNATTRLSQSAYFFELPSDKLADGLVRLTDMLMAPLFHLADIKQEMAVIDAEYQLLRHDLATHSEAALLYQMAGDKRLHRFRIGSIAALGNDSKALQQALCQFHQQYYSAQHLRLYLIGPQPLVDLATLAQQAAYAIHRKGKGCTESVALVAQRDSALRQLESPQLVLSFVVPLYTRSALPLLERLLRDEAPTGLMFAWREQNLVDDILFQSERLDSRTLWLRFSFILVDQQVNAKQVEQMFFHWLRALAELSEVQLQTVLQQCQQAYCRLSPLAVLQAQSYGIPAPQSEHWHSLLNALIPGNLTRLWLAEDICAQPLFTQGLSLEIGDFPLFTPTNSLPMAFDPVRYWSLPMLPSLPAQVAPLRHTPASSITLTLRPVRAIDINDLMGFALRAQLRSLSAIVAWQGDILDVQNDKGIWQIVLQAEAERILPIVAEINQSLRYETVDGQQQAQRLIKRMEAQEGRAMAIRRLLAQLPRELRREQQFILAEQGKGALAWLAQLDGGNDALHQTLSHLLSDFPFSIVAFPSLDSVVTLQPPAIGHRFSLLSRDRDDGDNALLVFLPLAERQKSKIPILQPEFFHWMRVQNSIGYVAQCQWYQYLSYQGILLLLQSPHCDPDKLRQQVSTFFHHHIPEWGALLEQAWLGEISAKRR